MDNCEAMTSSTHLHYFIIIGCSRNASMKITEIQNFISSFVFLDSIVTVMFEIFYSLSVDLT